MYLAVAVAWAGASERAVAAAAAEVAAEAAVAQIPNTTRMKC